MLLLSQGDDSASLPINSLQHPADAMSACPSSVDCDPAAMGFPSTPVSKTVEGDRDAGSVCTKTAFDADYVGDRAMLRPSDFTPSSHRQSAVPSDIYAPETELDGLYALRQSATLRAQRQPRESAHRITFRLPDTRDEAAIDSYAAPLAPLRERDITALSALFQRDDMYAIEADVKNRLLALMPEPCWDDDVFAFLNEFL